MTTVGIRELKRSLSAYLRRVRAGEGLMVTDRGEVVAELVPPGTVPTSHQVPPGLRTLAARGLVTLGAPNDPDAYPRLPARRRRGQRTAAQLLDDERGSR